MTPSRGAPAAVAHSCDIFRDGPLHSTRRVEGAPGGEHRETRAMSDDDLDRFNDSDSEPEQAVAGTSAGKAKGVANANGNSSPAAASPSSFPSASSLIAFSCVALGFSELQHREIRKSLNESAVLSMLNTRQIDRLAQ